MDESQMMTVQEYISTVMAAENQQIEIAVAQSLKGGKYGVKVMRNNLGVLVYAQVDPDVPFGHLYEYRDSGVISS